eukprot:TRINITY_DN11913_c0_g1_i1.p3 TRINITY_DN11913_c0_g1~~TRINITY_DN11913_c0_g1_i1.p3  ORF type:complete len:192 (+),score=29.86 TRINITY_DN11913_c0_g1_i1:960-1535(+)
MDVPHVFHCRYQTAPLDMHHASFYARRQAAIDPHLEKLSCADPRQLRDLVHASWCAHHGIRCGVSWDSHDESMLCDIAQCFGGKSIAAIFKVMMQDPSTWTGGLPDLCLWRCDAADSDGVQEWEGGKVTEREHGGGGGDAMLVEVKGPRDRLSDKQRVWIHRLLEDGIRVELCRITADVLEREGGDDEAYP